jgi:hypothetical protein
MANPSAKPVEICLHTLAGYRTIYTVNQKALIQRVFFRHTRCDVQYPPRSMAVQVRSLL